MTLSGDDAGRPLVCLIIICETLDASIRQPNSLILKIHPRITDRPRLIEKRVIAIVFRKTPVAL